MTDETTTDERRAELVKRLTAEWEPSYPVEFETLRNPDGPAAAAMLEADSAQLSTLQADLECSETRAANYAKAIDRMEGEIAALQDDLARRTDPLRETCQLGCEGDSLRDEIAALQAKVDALMAEPTLEEVMMCLDVFRRCDGLNSKPMKAALTAFLRARGGGLP